MERDPELRELFGEQEALEYERLAEQSHPELIGLAQERLARDVEHYQQEAQRTEEHVPPKSNRRFIFLGAIGSADILIGALSDNKLLIVFGGAFLVAAIRGKMITREIHNWAQETAARRADKLKGLLQILEQRQKPENA